jgi:hypothetical protein
MATPTSLPATFVAGNVLTAAQMNDLRGAFRVLQVVSTAKTDTFSTTSTSFVDVTGLTTSITPSATSSKVLVLVTSNLSGASAVNPGQKIVRDSTDIFIGDAASNRIRAFYGGDGINAFNMWQTAAVFLDSPNTTSATTYKVQMRVNTGTGYVNRTGTDTDSSAFYRTASSITVMEISA